MVSPYLITTFKTQKSKALKIGQKPSSKSAKGSKSAKRAQNQPKAQNRPKAQNQPNAENQPKYLIPLIKPLYA